MWILFVVLLELAIVGTILFLFCVNEQIPDIKIYKNEKEDIMLIQFILLIIFIIILVLSPVFL